MSVAAVFYYLYIIHRWFAEVQNIFYHGNEKKPIPLHDLDGVFNCAASLMASLLRELAINSITDYLQVFCPVVVRVFRGVLLCNLDYGLFAICFSVHYIINVKKKICI